MNANGIIQSGDNTGSPALTPDDLIEKATHGWTLVDEGHPILAPGLYATDITHLTNAQAVVDEIRGTASRDPESQAFIKEMDEDIAYCRKRKFVGNWGVPLIFGALSLFGFQSSTGDTGPAYFMLSSAMLYVISTFVPVYIINRKNLIGEDFNDFGWIATRFSDSPSIPMKFFGFFLMFLLLPVYAIANIYRYWGDEIKARLGGSKTTTPKVSEVNVPDFSSANSAQPQAEFQNEGPEVDPPADQSDSADDDENVPLDAKASTLLQEHLPKIKAKVRETLNQSSKSIEEYGAEKLFGEIHGLLPIAVRLVVRKKRFVSFCMDNKDKLI